MHRASAVTPSPAWPVGPRRPPAPTSEVHVWRADLDAPDLTVEKELPEEERQRAAKLLRPESSRRWAASRWALRRVLASYLDGEPRTIGLALGEHGKPQLAEAPERLSFNLSHSGAVGLIAVAVGRAVGVDVERIDPERDFLALARRELGADAIAAVAAAASEDRASVFYDTWVRHEALAKCRGGGLGNPAPEAPAAVASLDAGHGYAAALAVPGRDLPAYRLFSLGTR
jgi:4'-phosphopantetheinyl transferase